MPSKRTEWRLWVTRPSPAGDILCDAIRKAGRDAIHFPTIDICPVKTTDLEWDQQDILIFISPQAVYHSIDQMPSLPAHIKIIAMGPGTAEALKKANCSVDDYPTENISSEGLLLLPSFQAIQDKKVGLVKGEGGRETLENELRARGATVTPFIVYKREMAKKDTNYFIEDRDIILCTSCDILRNLIVLLRDQEEAVKEIPLIVISDRIQLLADSLGFKKIVLAPNANMHTIVEIADTLYVKYNGKITLKK